jgi:hypothetical protein
MCTSCCNIVTPLEACSHDGFCAAIHNLSASAVIQLNILLTDPIWYRAIIYARDIKLHMKGHGYKNNRDVKIAAKR